MLINFLLSPAHWIGLGLAGLALGLQALGWLPSPQGLMLAALGYGVGCGLGLMWLSTPNRAAEPDWQPLAIPEGSEVPTRESMELALQGIRDLTRSNPGQRIPPALQQRLLNLCTQLDELLTQWEQSSGMLSMEDSFHARHIATRYLPEMLNTYLSIPARFATSRVLDRGMTAAQTFEVTLGELEGEVAQLADDLAAQDAQAFLVHSRFLRQKFTPATSDAPTLNLNAAPPAASQSSSASSSAS
jgi:hypothetical protein